MQHSKKTITILQRKLSDSHALIAINRIYSTYGNIHSVLELRHVIDELFTHS